MPSLEAQRKYREMCEEEKEGLVVGAATAIVIITALCLIPA